MMKVPETLSIATRSFPTRSFMESVILSPWIILLALSIQLKNLNSTRVMMIGRRIQRVRGRFMSLTRVKGGKEMMNSNNGERGAFLPLEFDWY